MPRKQEFSYITEQNIFPTRLSETMKAKGLTQEALASLVGVRRQTISLYCKGQSEPTTSLLTAIARALDVSSDYLLGLEAATTHDASFICEQTGLSQKSVEVFSKLNEGGEVGINSYKLSVINYLIESGVLYSIASVLDVYAREKRDADRWKGKKLESEEEINKSDREIVYAELKRYQMQEYSLKLADKFTTEFVLPW